MRRSQTKVDVLGDVGTGEHGSQWLQY
jgi:hypothetical protein